METERPRPFPKPEVRNRRCYEVRVRGSSSGDAFRPTGDSQTARDGHYLNANGFIGGREAVVHIVTDDPTLIYTKFGSGTVVSITDIGPGYALPDDVP